LVFGFLLALVPAVGLSAQQADQEIMLAKGGTTILRSPATLRDVVIGDPDVVEVSVLNATEIVVWGKQPGSSSVLMVDQAGGRRSFSVRVTVDALAIQSELARMFPGEDLQVRGVGNTVALSGTVEDRQVAIKALALAGSFVGDVEVMDNLVVPEPQQILLQVRFAEVSRNAMEDLGVNFSRVDPFNVRGDDEGIIGSGGAGAFSGGFLAGDGPEVTFSDAINFFVFHDASNVAAFIQALESKGLFKSLAEPNLLAMPAESASFLAGGEFPYPVVQGGGGTNAVTIEFREFGIRLNFVPDITNSGAIRLDVAPEVSALDFANGLQIQGFTVPALLSRRARTVVELEDGQTFAIAGLLDNSLVENINKVPILGDIPILGALFRSKEVRQNRTELLVLVTPRFVRPTDEPPELPTGEPETWDWKKSMRYPSEDDGSN
jgi:pilus assembly protein CpaC